MAGAPAGGFILHGKVHAVADVFAHAFRAVAHDHNRSLHAQLPHEIQRIIDHRLSADGMQNLMQRGFHARAFARGQQNRRRIHRIFSPSLAF